MFHDVDSVSLELGRLQHRPEESEAPPVLSVFEVSTEGNSQSYLERLRSPIATGLKLGTTAEFSDDDLPTDGLPSWFLDVSDDRITEAPDFARHGRDRYLELPGGEPWDVQEWLFRFDPDDETRGWAWWDATTDGDSRARIWVDSWGESFFGCGDLRWVAFTAGAREVSGPHLARPAEWANAVSGRS